LFARKIRGTLLGHQSVPDLEWSAGRALTNAFQWGDTMNKILKLSFAVLLPLALVGGCDDADDKKTSEEKRLENYLKEHGIDAAVTLDDKGDVASVAVEHMAGGAKSVGGANLALPANFPKDVPAYPNANIYGTGEVPGMGFILQAQSQDAPDKVADFYKAQMAANGWSVIASDISLPHMQQLGFEKDARKTAINLMPNGEGTTLQITAAGE